MLALRHGFSGEFINLRVGATLKALTIAEFRTQTRLPVPIRTASTPLLADCVVDIIIGGVLVELTDFTGQTRPSFTTTDRICSRRIARDVAYSCLAVGKEALICTQTRFKVAEQNRK